MKHLLKTILSMFIPASEVNELDLSHMTEQKITSCTMLDDLQLAVGNRCRVLVTQREEDPGFSSAEFFR